MDLFINNFLITQQEQQNEREEKESSINDSTPQENIDSQQFQEDKALVNNLQSEKLTNNKNSKQQNNTFTHIYMRKKRVNSIQDEVLSAQYDRKQDSYRAKYSRSDESDASIYKNTFVNNRIKGISTSAFEKDTTRNNTDQINYDEDYISENEDQDTSDYFQYIKQFDSNGTQNNKKTKKTYLDLLPEANPLVKKELQGIEPIRSAYDNPLKSQDQSLVNNYLKQQLLATDKPEIFQISTQKREPLGIKNINTNNVNSINNNGNPNISVNTENQNNVNSNQLKQFIYQLFQEDANLVYLRTPLLTNSIICNLYKMSAIRNGKSNQEPRTKDISETQQKERLEQIVKENLQKAQTLHFESRFESGNLSIVAKKSSQEYNLLIQNDINTKGYTQWFFFSVKKGIQNQTVKFNLLNFYKCGSLFNEGMKISIFSKKKYEQAQVGWFKGAFDIEYIKNNIVKQNDNYYYTLTFQYTFEYSEDEVYFAYNIPYTYTQLNQFLHKCEMDPYKSQFMYKKELCRTLIGNKLDIISITNPCQDASVQMSKRKGVIITARVHPGESVSSYIMEGIIEYLLCILIYQTFKLTFKLNKNVFQQFQLFYIIKENTKEACFLRDKFIFKLIPMLNPDGVIHGNYRCSLAGCDLNRRWKNPNKVLHPEIYYTKQMIFDFKMKNDIAMVLDIHGHSRKMNVFAYGCHDKNKPYECREFPFILSKINPSFSFQDCNFKVQKSRDGTARIALYKSLGIPNIFTVESSFCGPSFINTHFIEDHLKQMGHSICQSILMKFQMMNFQQYINIMESNPKSQNINSAEEEKNKELFQQNQQQESCNSLFFQEVCRKSNITSNKVFLEELYDNPELIDAGLKVDSGSDSDPSGDNMSDDELKKIFASKFKKFKKHLEKKDTSNVLQQQTKEQMSQTQATFKKKTQTNFTIKSQERKPNVNSQGVSQTEIKQNICNVDKSPSPPDRSRTQFKQLNQPHNLFIQ